MGTFYNTQSTLVVGVLLIVSSTIRSNAGCTYGKTPPMAIIGQELDLHCNLGVSETCISGEYEWYHLNGSQKHAMAEHGKTLRIVDTVATAEEVGGQIYECHCSGTEYCRIFRMGVKPRVTLNISSPVAKTGSSVNVTCIAESYPPANSVDNYQMKHPLNTPINRTFLPMHGVVHIITAASKERDAGIYECAVSVTLEEYNTPLQSDNVRANLLIYDPPVIVHVRNFTIYDLEQSAILECVIRNLENDLNVWTHWTASEGKMISKKHVTFQKGSVFYLLVYNATAEDYTCQVFSTYSPDTPEDKKVVSVLMSDIPSSPTARGLSTKSEDCENSHWIAIVASLAVLLALFFVTTVAFAVSCFTLYKKRHYKVQGREPMEPLARYQQRNLEPHVIINDQNGEELCSPTENAISSVTEKQKLPEADNNSAVERNPSAFPPATNQRSAVTSPSLRSKSLPIGSLPHRGLQSSSPRKSSISSNFVPLNEEHLTRGKPIATDPDQYYIDHHSRGFKFTNESSTSGGETMPNKADSAFETKAFPTKIRNTSAIGARQRSQSLYVGSPPSRLLRSIQHVPSIRKGSVSSSVDPEEKETLLPKVHNEEEDSHLATGVQGDDNCD